MRGKILSGRLGGELYFPLFFGHFMDKAKIKI